MASNDRLGDHTAPASWRERRVLVTGIGGFVGSCLARSLIARGAEVVGIVRDSRGERQLAAVGILDRVRLLRGSITDPQLVERALNEYDIETCFHLAAQAIVGVANRSPVSTFESNIQGTWTLLEAARRSSVLRAMIVASSDKVYGDQPILPYTEDSPLSAVYPYDASKLCAEILARSYAVTFDLPLAVVRCANIYGGGDLNWSRLIPGTIRSVLHGEEPIIRSDGTMERDYLYVEDAADAYITLAEHIGDNGVRGGAFNFGWSKGFTVLEVVRAVLTQADSSLQPRILNQARAEIQRQWLSAEKAERVLGWQPRVTLDEGIARSVAWYRRHLGIAAAPEPPAAVPVGAGRGD